MDGKIKRRENEKIVVELFREKNWRCYEVYDMFFTVNRMEYQLQHNALNLIETHRLFPILIDNPLYRRQSLHSAFQAENFEFITNRTELNTELNIEQMQAIECIVNGNYNPVPYLLYGPPGKTYF